MEKLTSEASNQLVEEHLAQCSHCREELEAMSGQLAEQSLPHDDVRDKTGKKLVRRIRLQVTVIFAALLVFFAANLWVLWGEGIRFSDESLIRAAYPLVGETEVVARDSYNGRKLLLYDDGFVFGFHSYSQVLLARIPRAAGHKYVIPDRPFEVVYAQDGDSFVTVAKAVDAEITHFVAWCSGNVPATLSQAEANTDRYMVAEVEAGFAWFVHACFPWDELMIAAYDQDGRLIAYSHSGFTEFYREVD